jgi:hypothetical protein
MRIESLHAHHARSQHAGSIDFQVNNFQKPDRFPKSVRFKVHRFYRFSEFSKNLSGLKFNCNEHTIWKFPHLIRINQRKMNT